MSVRAQLANGESIEGEAVFIHLPTDFEPVRVSDAQFRGALTELVLDMPLRVVTDCPRLYVGRRLALVSEPLVGDAWHSELARAYGRFCDRRGSPGDCLTLFDDGPSLQADDKRSIALALAVGPALEARDAELRAMLSSTQLWTAVSVAISGWLALLVMPEPVSKGVAAAFAMMMWGYLGWEFFDLLRAYVQLAEDSAQATTFEELREAGARFGKVIGPNSVRILVLLGTAALGETAALLSRGPKLPGFGQAARRVETTTGMRMMEASTGAERIIVSVPEGTIRVVLPANAVAMAPQDGKGGRSRLIRQGRLLSNGHRAFKSFDDFKDVMGSAGKGKQWHHIVEKHPHNTERFGAEALHNTENVIPLDEAIHTRISAWYSSKPQGWSMTVREWIRQQSYEAQREYGISVLRRFGVVP
ncbi:MAG TPA: hypothetical protein VFZ09_34960 [Archangium sp.]|uniref:SitA5 family polymorphic toxin n=1 Tax=Archangium sp. TaxID=1872627 RepID=UPI002E2F5AB5|nr:hypothetical protein [Archangium sp.]HEX5751476.1 hypothetical protein [Archangium sp.]